MITSRVKTRHIKTRSTFDSRGDELAVEKLDEEHGRQVHMEDMADDDNGDREDDDNEDMEDRDEAGCGCGSAACSVLYTIIRSIRQN